jgi:hypothetical protein
VTKGLKYGGDKPRQSMRETERARQSEEYAAREPWLDGCGGEGFYEGCWSWNSDPGCSGRVVTERRTPSLRVPLVPA